MNDPGLANRPPQLPDLPWKAHEGFQSTGRQRQVYELESIEERLVKRNKIIAGFPPSGRARQGQVIQVLQVQRKILGPKIIRPTVSLFIDLKGNADNEKVGLCDRAHGLSN